MRVLLLSEHYDPKISGTASYSKNLLNALAKEANVELFFLCPAKGKIGEVKREEVDGVNFFQLGVNESSLPVYSSQERSILINYVRSHLIELVEELKIEVVHLLYGYFLTESIPTEKLRQMGIRTVVTVHNIPPEECSTSWPGDAFFRKKKDDIRKIGVGWLNRNRLKTQQFDSYITPSEYVKRLLLGVLPSAQVKVIAHGGAELIHDEKIKSHEEPTTIKLLTAGGIVPHKQQAWIPEIANYLEEQELNVRWKIAGPIRNDQYGKYIEDEIRRYGMTEKVQLLGPVNHEDLKDLYRTADAYIQLSREEGFCMTVLDALAYGNLVMATPVGAIPEMIDSGGGILLDPDIDQMKVIIAHYLKILIPYQMDENKHAEFKGEYRWSVSSEKVLNVYRA